MGDGEESSGGSEGEMNGREKLQTLDSVKYVVSVAYSMNEV